MKKAISISAYLGAFLLIMSYIGIKFELNFMHWSLPLGIGLLLIVAFPLFIIDYFDRAKKSKKGMIKYPLDKKVDHSDVSKKNKSIEGYPSFSERKRGLKWGGGNIHGSIAKRGTKKKFLKN